MSFRYKRLGLYHTIDIRVNVTFCPIQLYGIKQQISLIDMAMKYLRTRFFTSNVFTFLSFALTPPNILLGPS